MFSHWRGRTAKRSPGQILSPQGVGTTLLSGELPFNDAQPYHGRRRFSRFSSVTLVTNIGYLGNETLKHPPFKSECWCWRFR